MSEETPKKEAKNWLTIESLRETRLGELLEDERELQKIKEDAEKRIKAIREMIEPLIRTVDHGVMHEDRLAFWVPSTTTEKLSRELLVQAGVTPAQLARGTAKGARKGYLEIRKIKTPDSPAPTPEPPTPPDSPTETS